MSKSQNWARLKDHYGLALERFMQSPAMVSLAKGEMTKAEYASIMREVFHYTRENPQLHTMAAINFRGRERGIIKPFFGHASAEIGHEDLAANDFETLGGDPTSLPYENPLPATSALVAFAYYQIHHLNPIGFIGYIYFLEFVATSIGEKAMGWLDKIEVPAGAVTFLRDHAEIDVSHNRLMERYVDELVRSDAAVEAVKHAIDTTGFLYAAMMQQAVEDAAAPADRGWNWQELQADQLTPEMLMERASSAAVA